MRSLHVSEKRLLARLRRYMRLIESLNRHIDKLSELAIALAEDVGDDLMFFELAKNSKARSRPGKNLPASKDQHIQHSRHSK